MTAPLDLEAIRGRWLELCGSCDAGVPGAACTCPPEDFRPVMLAVVREVEELRAELAARTPGPVSTPGVRADWAELVYPPNDEYTFDRIERRETSPFFPAGPGQPAEVVRVLFRFKAADE